MEKILEIILFIMFLLSCTTACSYTMLFINIVLSKKDFKLKKYLINCLALIPFIVFNFIVLFYIKSLKLLLPFSAFFIAVIVSKYVYKISTLKSFLAGLFYIIATFFVDILSSLSLLVFNIKIDYLNNNPLYYFSISIIVYAFLALSVKLLFIVTKKKPFLKQAINFSVVEYKYLLYQALTIIVCLIPSMFMLFSNNYNYSALFIIINSIQMIIVSIFSFIYMKKQVMFKDTELELENTKLHNKALSTINEGIRGFKHDMGNMVQAINGYIAVGNIDGVKNYCQNLLQGFNDINLLSILSPKIINDPAIYGIVVNKMLYARDNELTLSLDVGIDVSNINFPSFELSRIIGILLDNAIEASLESKDKKLKLEMYYDDRKKSDVIIIGNSVKDPEKVDIIKMFEKDYSTKENPSGFGLYEVLKFLKKHNKGDIVPNIDYDTNFFTQTLTFEK